jgi:hypothetical protein
VAAVVVAVLLAGFAAAFALRNTGAVWSELPALTRQRRAAAARILPVYEWIDRNTPRDSTFFADRDTTLYAYTGRHATATRIPVRYFYTEDRASILAEFGKLTEFARARGLDYLLLTPADFELDPLPDEQRRAVREAVARDPHFHTVFESPAGTVVKVDRHGQ